jgi:hypothetical protein
MKPFIELSVLEQKARKKSENIKCGDCPIYTLCRKNEMIIEACDFIYLSAFKSGYNTHKKEMRLKKKK